MFVLLFPIFAILFYIYATRNHDYWKKRNIKHDRPIPLFGNQYDNLRGLRNFTEMSEQYYWKYPNEKVIGFYRGATPVLIVKDLEIVRRIMTIDFPFFYLRGWGRNPKMEMLLANLFHTDDDTWKLLRQRLTPAFTSSKLKNMFPLVVKCAEKLQGLGEEIVSRGGECNVREIMARFTIEFIGACGFGIEMDSINNERSMFINLGKMIFTRARRDMFLLALWELFPILRNYLQVYNPQLDEAMLDIVGKIRAQRNYKPIGRNDFIDLLLELEEKGNITGDSMKNKNPDGTPVQIELEMDLKCLAAQVFIFFAAGFETSSSATSFTLHQLAFHPDIQNKIQNEIDEVLLKYNNKLCYDAIAEMSLLEMAFKESLRIFPSLGTLDRICAKRYTIPELNLTIDPGVRILIPIKAIQNDAKYFDSPKKFRPQRFKGNSVKNHHKYAYMPFGEGPRACIGARLGQMQSLAGLAALLHKFSVEPTSNTPRELKVNSTINVVQSVQGGVPLVLKMRKTKVT